jgi:glycosyltransferase involved in cell wall biosynthesis
MARIAVVTSTPPLTEGGHLVIARSLVRALQEAGHEAGLVLTPQNRFGRQGIAYLANWFTDVGRTGDGRSIDQVISFRFPSYAVRHERHVCWLNHRMREYYDLWERFSATLSRKGRLKERVRRRMVHATDHYLLTRNVTQLFAQSRNIAARLKRWGNLSSKVLHPPPPQRPYRCDGFGDYLFLVSRLTPLKRVDLVLRAMARPEAGAARLVVAGEGEERPRLHALAAELGIAHRVDFLGQIDEDQLVTHLARCRAVCFPPLDEDYGFVTVEAFVSGKPVVACVDSGGAIELIDDGRNGLVTAPTPEELSIALARIADDRGFAERLGAQAARSAAELHWPAAVEQLVIV